LARLQGLYAAAKVKLGIDGGLLPIVKVYDMATDRKLLQREQRKRAGIYLFTTKDNGKQYLYLGSSVWQRIAKSSNKPLVRLVRGLAKNCQVLEQGRTRSSRLGKELPSPRTSRGLSEAKYIIWYS
jgi:hypothetical protein